MSTLRDQSDSLQQAVHDAYRQQRGLLIAGSGSKQFLLQGAVPDSAAMLSTVEHSGVVDYRPEELVVTVRAGTPLRELNSLLAQHQQMLPFEPPLFTGGGTVGGAVASGLSGPGRPWRGAVRDCLLGVEMLNGLGERLRFGGQVMKNVAGYDVSRLQAGAFGTLGVLLSVSIRLLPKPVAEQTCCFELDTLASLRRMRQWARRPLPLSGVCWVEGVLYARVSGAEPAVRAAVAQLGGDDTGDRTHFWQQLRDQELAVFDRGHDMLRVSVPAAAQQPVSDSVMDWAGALRWWHSQAGNAAEVCAAAMAAGGSAARFGGGFARRSTAAMADALRSHHGGIKRAFDPGNILNPGLVVLDAD